MKDSKGRISRTELVGRSRRRTTDPQWLAVYIAALTLLATLILGIIGLG